MPLLIRGVRQCGKTYAIKSFLQAYFKENNACINFEEDENITRVLEASPSFEDALNQISIFVGCDIRKQSSYALFFDEIQKSPKTLSYLRFFKEKYPYLHILAAGSYLEYQLKKASFPVGRVSSYFLHPLDFEEFLWARGYIHECASVLAPFSAIFTADRRPAFVADFSSGLQLLHDKLLWEACLYQVIGGMPRVVQTFLDTMNFRITREMQLSLVESFRDDFNKYSLNDKFITETGLRHIQSILNNLENLGCKLKYSHIDAHSHSSTVEKAVSLMVSIRLVYQIFHSDALTTPLAAQRDQKDSKLFLCDPGLLGALLNSAMPTTITEQIFYSHGGLLSEMFVLLNLIFRGEPLSGESGVFFWRKKTTDGAEIDALTFIQGTLCPIEIKKTRARSYKSLVSYMVRFAVAFSQNRKAPAFLPMIVSTEPLAFVGRQASILNLPCYLVPFMVGDPTCN